MLRRGLSLKGLLRARPRAPAARVASADAEASSAADVDGSRPLGQRVDGSLGQRVLLVNHGYPPAYNAGSEVYTQLVARGLAARGVSAAVFSREEDLLRPDYALRRGLDAGASTEPLPLFVVNNARGVTRFSDGRIDAAFKDVLDELRPGAWRARFVRMLYSRRSADVVHFQHLNHLSLGLPKIAKQHGAQTVFTLHGARACVCVSCVV